MNILIVVPCDEVLGGVPSVVGNLAHRLKKSGHTVLFLHLSDHDSLKAKVNKLHFPAYELNRRIPYDPPDESNSRYRSSLKHVIGFACYYPWTLWQLSRLLTRHRIDIVNIHYPGEDSAYFVPLQKLHAFSLVVSIHGADLFPNGRLRKPLSRLFVSLMQCADLLISPSHDMLDEALSVFPRLAKSAICIPNGVNINEFQDTERQFEETSHEYILCAAMHNHRKAIDVLIRAFKILSLSHSKLELWLAGDGPLRGDFERLAREVVSDDRIKFLGLRTREEIKLLMRQCKLFVLPSRAEPFGIAILEAMACSKPVVATRVGGIPEIIQEGVTGILVEPNNPEALAGAIERVLFDTMFRETIAQAGYQSVKNHFNWERAAASYEAAFQTLLLDPVHKRT